jgi:hypothetical protein
MNFENEGPPWRLDDCLLVPFGGRLDPGHCVKCNAPSDGEKVVDAYPYHNRPFNLAKRILPAVADYALVVDSIKKDARVELYICAQHRALRRYKSVGIVLLGLIGAFMFVMNHFQWNMSGVDMLSLLFFMAAIGAIPSAGRVLNPLHLNGKYMWLSGVDPLYVARFPVLPMEKRHFDSEGIAWPKD